MSNKPFSIAIHGGAGTLTREALSADIEADIRAALKASIDAGGQVLAAGGSSVDAVEAAVVVMEDSPLFNAGRGAVLTVDGKVELDASIMDGESGHAGAVAGVTTVKNPIKLARAVCDHSAHVMLIGEGVEQFATDFKLERVDPEYFLTEVRVAQWRKGLESLGQGEQVELNPLSADARYSTVGAVAMDQQGRLAAATSTGGIHMKRFGRVGDSPLIGAGTYASSEVAVSCTGHGEHFMKNLVAYDVAARVRYGRNKTVAEAAREIVHDVLLPIGGDGGLIAVDSHGQISMPFNTEGMYRAGYRQGQAPQVDIF